MNHHNLKRQKRTGCQFEIDHGYFSANIRGQLREVFILAATSHLVVKLV